MKQPMENPLLSPEWWNVLAVLNLTAAKAARGANKPEMAADFERAAQLAGAVSGVRAKRLEEQRGS